MIYKNYIAPSFFSLFFTGIFCFIILIIFLSNLKQFNKLKFNEKIILLSIISIALGIHGLIHLGLEIFYGFNPLQLI